jgi:hypothetical protein
MERIFDYPVTPEAKERMSFEERYEGFCVDLIKVNMVYLSRDNQGNCLLRRDTRDSAWILSR